MKQRRAVTLVEITIGILIGSIVVLVATKLLSGGLRSSTKGSSHLSIIQATSILMSQLDEDMKRTMVIDFPTLNGKDVTTRLEVLERNAAGKLATATVTYQAGPQGTGIVRRHDQGGGTPSEHIFCRGFRVTPTFCHVGLPQNRVGFWAKLDTSTIKDADGVENFVVERLLGCPNLASNSQVLGFYWPGN